jgi:hypothetical protein
MAGLYAALAQVRDLRKILERRSRGSGCSAVRIASLPQRLTAQRQIARTERDPNRRPRILQFTQFSHQRPHAPNMQEPWKYGIEVYAETDQPPLSSSVSTDLGLRGFDPIVAGEEAKCCGER